MNTNMSGNTTGGLYTVWNSAKKAPKKIAGKINFYKSSGKGSAPKIIERICKKDRHAHISVYGGDGSVYEACNAIMKSGESETVTLTIVPSGTGNDFIKNFDKKNPRKRKIDLIKFNGNYSANEINMGYDCDVVIATDKIKKLPFVKGGIAYILGVISTFFKPLGKNFEFEYVSETGAKGRVRGKLLLCIIANGAYYGGGFKCAPRAKVDDGLLELIYVKPLDRLTFINFIGAYKSGKHILENGEIPKKFRDYIVYKRVKSVTMKKVGTLCADGEIISAGNVSISIAPSAITLYN